MIFRTVLQTLLTKMRQGFTDESIPEQRSVLQIALHQLLTAADMNQVITLADQIINSANIHWQLITSTILRQRMMRFQQKIFSLLRILVDLK